MAKIDEEPLEENFSANMSGKMNTGNYTGRMKTKSRNN